MRAARVHVDLDALRHNYSCLKAHASGARIVAIVKANAYGHGTFACAQAMHDADMYGVAFVEEAVLLRKSGIAAPVLVLQGARNESEVVLAEQLNLQLVVHQPQQVQWLAQRASNVKVWLKFDVGMGRLGIAVHELPQYLAMLGERCQVLMAHFSAADEIDGRESRAQLERFMEAAGASRCELSMANSAAALTLPEARLDWIRPGIALYGASPFGAEHSTTTRLRAVMTLSAPVVAVNLHRRGDSIGYAGTSRCEEDMPVAVVAAGYADGYPRAALPGTPVVINGHLCPLLGRVSMDMICVDLRSASDVRVGDEAQLWGAQLPVATIANAAGTIAYELLCHAGAAAAGRYV